MSSDLLCHWVGRYEGNRIGHGGNLICICIWDLNCKLLLKCHHHLYSIQTVQAKILLEGSSRGNLWKIQ